MSGSFFSFAATLVVGVLFLALIGVGFIWIVPILLLGVLPLLIGGAAGRFKNMSFPKHDEHPAGVPTTRQASYDPKMDPSDRVA